MGCFDMNHIACGVCSCPFHDSTRERIARIMSEAFRVAATGLWLDTIARDALLMRVLQPSPEELFWTKQWGLAESS